MRTFIFCLVILCYGIQVRSQITPPDTTVRPIPSPEDRPPVEDKSYPVFLIGDNYSINSLSNLRPSYEEGYLFEASPTLRMPLYNKIQDRFLKPENKAASTLYIAFRPQLRMFKASSKPVRTPSYQISAGYQHIFRVRKPGKKTKGYYGFSFETGHYSNGQAGGAFSTVYPDGSPESEALYDLITPETNLSAILNRQSGNFSTNFTELILKYCFIMKSDADHYINRSLSVEPGYTRYHNDLLYLFDIGGYSQNDIRIYGRNIFSLRVEYMDTIESKCKHFPDRYKLSIRTQVIDKPHSWVNPFRMELMGGIFFRNDLGIFVKYAAGHDVYNYRFVDNIRHLCIGLQFDVASRVKFN